MKRFFSMALISLLMFSSIVSFSGCGERREDVLKIYNTADYIALGDKDTEGVIKLFENYYREKTGNSRFKVIYETFDTNEIALTKIEKNKEDWDLVNISDYAVERLIAAGLLNKIDISAGNMPNYANISDYIKGQYSLITGLDNLNGSETYSVGYMWGTMGILYNKAASETVENDVKHWDALWNPKYADKVLMKNSVRDSYAIALFYKHKEQLLSLSSNPAAQLEYINSLLGEADAERIAQAEEALLLQKQLINTFYEVDDGKDDIASGTTFQLSLAWSGDAAYAISEAAEGVELDYSIPLEGSNVWFDGWVTPVYGKNQAAAEAFIDFLSDPEIAIMNMEETGYTSVVADKGGVLLDWYINDGYTMQTGKDINATYFFGDIEGADNAHINPVYIAESADIDRCGIMKDFGTETQNVLKMWTRVKGSVISPYIYAMVIVIIIAAGIIAVIFSVKKTNKNKKRKTNLKIRK